MKYVVSSVGRVVNVCDSPEEAIELKKLREEHDRNMGLHARYEVGVLYDDFVVRWRDASKYLPPKFKDVVCRGKSKGLYVAYHNGEVWRDKNGRTGRNPVEWLEGIDL